MELSPGVVLPMSELSPDGVVPRWPEMLATARLADDLGADTIWLGDEILWRIPQWRCLITRLNRSGPGFPNAGTPSGNTAVPVMAGWPWWGVREPSAVARPRVDLSLADPLAQRLRAHPHPLGPPGG